MADNMALHVILGWAKSPRVWAMTQATDVMVGRVRAFHDRVSCDQGFDNDIAW